MFESVNGCKIRDVDGNEYIDYVGTWGPAIVGHANPEVNDAIKQQVDKGTSFGAPCELENVLAKMVIDRVPCVEMVRFVNSGTEACLSALRVMRAYTGKEKVSGPLLALAVCSAGGFTIVPYASPGAQFMLVARHCSPSGVSFMHRRDDANVGELHSLLRRALSSAHCTAGLFFPQQVASGAAVKGTSPGFVQGPAAACQVVPAERGVASPTVEALVR